MILSFTNVYRNTGIQLFGSLDSKRRILPHAGSFDNCRNRDRKAKGKATVAFIGGSITEMDGYRPHVMDFLAKRYPECQFTFINAGILHLFDHWCFPVAERCFFQDRLIFFIEFAVNDDQMQRHPQDACIRVWKASFVR